jgi:hypothetical protein
MKYIRFKNLGYILFENRLKHSSIAEVINDKPVSAGFIYETKKSHLMAFGDSASMGIDSIPEEDTIAIDDALDMDNAI